MSRQRGVGQARHEAARRAGRAADDVRHCTVRGGLDPVRDGGGRGATGKEQGREKEDAEQTHIAGSAAPNEIPLPKTPGPQVPPLRGRIEEPMVWRKAWRVDAGACFAAPSGYGSSSGAPSPLLSYPYPKRGF